MCGGVAGGQPRSAVRQLRVQRRTGPGHEASSGGFRPGRSHGRAINSDFNVSPAVFSGPNVQNPFGSTSSGGGGPREDLNS